MIGIRLQGPVIRGGAAHQRFLAPVLWSLITSLLLTACSGQDWWGGELEEKTPGERVPVLSAPQPIQPDKSLSWMEIKIPASSANDSWALQNISPARHLAMPDFIARLETFDAGSGAPEGLRLTSAPVIVGGFIYTLDGAGTVEARAADDPSGVVWSASLESAEKPRDIAGIVTLGKESEDFLGGNIAAAGDALFVTTGGGKALALKADDGSFLWERSFRIPVRSAPAPYDGKVYIVTSDNRLYTLDARTGATLWTHAGIAEIASVGGSPSPVAQDDVLVATYSSGEILAFNPDTGEVLWSDVLTGNVRQSTASLLLDDIHITPVIADGRVYVVSQGGVLTSFSLYSGKRQWEEDVRAAAAPWPAGEFIYVLSQGGKLLCLHAADGKVRWKSDLSAEDEAVVWSGPVLAGDRLLVTNSSGSLLFVSPYDGSIGSMIDIPDDVFLPPVIAGGRVYVLSDGADLAVLE